MRWKEESVDTRAHTPPLHAADLFLGKGHKIASQDLNMVIFQAVAVFSNDCKFDFILYYLDYMQFYRIFRELGKIVFAHIYGISMYDWNPLWNFAEDFLSSILVKIVFGFRDPVLLSF
jgi:hypothetical protein